MPSKEKPNYGSRKNPPNKCLWQDSSQFIGNVIPSNNLLWHIKHILLPLTDPHTHWLILLHTGAFLSTLPPLVICLNYISFSNMTLLPTQKHAHTNTYSLYQLINSPHHTCLTSASNPQVCHSTSFTQHITPIIVMFISSWST